MPHDDAILEQALAELAELSRRVADLTATVSVLAAREHSSSSLLSPRADESQVAQSPHASAACQPQAFLPPAFQSQAFQQQSPSTPASTAPGSSTAAWPPWPYWPMPPMYLPPGQPVAGPRAAPAACPAGVPSLAGVPSSACEPSSSCEPPVDPATLPVEDPPVVVLHVARVPTLQTPPHPHLPPPHTPQTCRAPAQRPVIRSDVVASAHS